jgi:hypothetical protein
VQPAMPTSETDPDVMDFLKLWKLQNPIYLDYTDVGEDYGSNFCHVSAKHIVSKRDGRRVHGWALWKYSEGVVGIVIGDFHSVWENSNGVLVDVTPPKVGKRILFVRDPSLAIGKVGNIQKLYNNRTNVPETPRLWNGAPTDNEFFDVPDDHPSLVVYCQKLGLADTSML